MITSTRCLIFLFVGCVVSLVACASPGPRVAGCPKSSGGPVAAGVDSTPTAAPVQGPGESTSPTPTADEIRDYYRKERRRFGTDPDTPTIASVAFSQNFEVDGIVFAGSYLNGLFCSNDRGQSWTAVNGLADSTVWSVVLSPAFETDGTVLAGTPGGVFRSHDRGQSWRLVSHDRVGDMVVSGAFESDRTMFAATADGVGRSTDAGETWQTVMAAPRIGNAIRPLDISPGFERDNTVFMVSRRSIDGGDTWEPFVEESTGYNQRAPIALELSSAFNSDRTMFVYDGYSGVLRSTDGGATWESIGGPTPGAWNVDMAVSPASDADNTLYVSLGRTFNPPAGVFRFANGEWEQIAGKGSEYQGGTCRMPQSFSLRSLRPLAATTFFSPVPRTRGYSAQRTGATPGNQFNSLVLEQPLTKTRFLLRQYDRSLSRKTWSCPL